MDWLKTEETEYELNESNEFLALFSTISKSTYENDQKRNSKK